MFAKIQRIHFVGIGGIGMSGIAEVLLTLARDAAARGRMAEAARGMARPDAARVIVDKVLALAGHAQRDTTGAR